jgi:hypothetical protein
MLGYANVVLTDEGQRLLAALTAGKLGNDAIFARTDGLPWGKSHQLSCFQLKG